MNIKNKMKKFNKQIKTAKRSRKKWLRLELKNIGLLLTTFDITIPPMTEEEVQELRIYIERYDESIKRLEKDHVSRFRRYIKEDK